MNILVDAFGGDNAPYEIVKGCVSAINAQKGFSVTLVGKEQEINDILKDMTYDKSRVSVLCASEVITFDEEPTLAVRKKPDSSICVAMKELKENENASAFVSAGSTGAVLVAATLKLGRIAGVNRPALCPIMPTVINGKNVLLLDSGANADCKAVNLCQFALLGHVYSKLLGVENPKIGLLSNGTEDEKGNMLNHEVFPILKNMKSINFVGNIEARDILSGTVDVVVADGFSGNIALKGMEGAIATMFSVLKEGIYSSFKCKIGALFLKGMFKDLKKKLDYKNQGGALFIGVKKPVIKAHGSSKSVAIKNAVLQAVEYAKYDISDKIKDILEQEPIVLES